MSESCINIGSYVCIMERIWLLIFKIAVQYFGNKKEKNNSKKERGKEACDEEKSGEICA